jgi:hypothetical protein
MGRKPQKKGKQTPKSYHAIAKRLGLRGPAEARQLEAVAAAKLAIGIWDAIAADPILMARYGPLIGERPVPIQPKQEELF